MGSNISRTTIQQPKSTTRKSQQKIDRLIPSARAYL